MQNDNSRNTIIFVVIAMIFLLGYSEFIMKPQAERRQAAQQLAATEQTVEGAATAASSRGRCRSRAGASMTCS